MIVHICGAFLHAPSLEDVARSPPKSGHYGTTFHCRAPMSLRSRTSDHPAMRRLRAADIFDADSTEADAAVQTNLRKRSARGVLWVTAGNWGARLLSTAVVFVLAHVLTPEAFGLVAIAMIAIMVLQIVVDGGFAAALVQRPEIGRVHYDTAFWISVLTGAGATVAGVALSWPVAAFFHEPQVQPILAWLSLTLLIGSLGSTPQAILVRRMDYASLAARVLFANAVGGTVGIVLALTGWGVWALVIQAIVKECVQQVVVWAACPVMPGLHVDRDAFRSMLRFGLSITGSQALGTANKRSDDFLVGRYMGAEALGFYTVAYQFLMLLNQLLNQTIGSVAFPLFARLQDDAKRLRDALHEVTRLASVFTLPTFMGMLVLAPEIVAVFFGPQWGPSVPVMRMLSLVGLPMTVGYFLSTLMNGTGRAGWEFRVNVVQTTALIAGFLVSVHFGLVAVAASLVVVWTLFVPVRLWLIRKFLPFSATSYLLQFVRPLVATAVMMGTVFALQTALADSTSPLTRLAVCTLVGVVVYVGALLVVGRSLVVEARDVVGHMLPDRVARRLRIPSA